MIGAVFGLLPPRAWLMLGGGALAVGAVWWVVDDIRDAYVEREAYRQAAEAAQAANATLLATNGQFAETTRVNEAAITDLQIDMRNSHDELVSRLDELAARPYAPLPEQNSIEAESVIREAIGDLEARERALWREYLEEDG